MSNLTTLAADSLRAAVAALKSEQERRRREQTSTPESNRAVSIATTEAESALLWLTHSWEVM